MPDERDEDLQDNPDQESDNSAEEEEEKDSWFDWGDDDDEERSERREPPPEGEKEGFWERRFGKRLDGLMPDMVKRALVGGLGPMFMSEDGLRQNLSELRLPKEAVNFIIQQADNTKKEFMRLVAKEIRDFLESTNFYDEIARVLTTLSFEIRTQIRLVPNDQMFVRPEVKNSVKVTREKGGKGNKNPERQDDDQDESDEDEKPKEKRRWGLGRKKDKEQEEDRDAEDEDREEPAEDASEDE